MTAEDLARDARAVIADIAILPNPHKVTIRAEAREGKRRPFAMLFFEWRAPDRGTAEGDRLHGRNEPIYPPMTVPEIEAFIWGKLAWIVQHELAEGYLYRGQRTRDPHA